MNGLERRQVVNNILDWLTTEVKKKIKDMPDSWDGIELAQYVADVAARNAPSKEAMPNKRRKEYTNTVIVKNL